MSEKKIILIVLCFTLVACTPLSTPINTIVFTPSPTLESPTLSSTPTSTLTPLPTHTNTPTFTSTPDCIFDLVFYAVAYLPTGIQISLNAPNRISHPELNNNLIASFGPDLEVYRNNNLIYDYKAGLFDPNHLERLYIISNAFTANDEIDVHLKQEGLWKCSGTINIPLQIPSNLNSPATTSSAGDQVCTPNGPPIGILPWQGPPCSELVDVPPCCVAFDNPSFQYYDSCGNVITTPQSCGIGCTDNCGE